MVTREREDNIYYARLAEQGERYEDMIEYMKKVAAVSSSEGAFVGRHWLIISMRETFSSFLPLSITCLLRFPLI